MKYPILIAAAIVTSSWLGACSKPAAPVASGDDRRIELAEPPRSDSAVVSDLEAPQAPRAALVRRVERVRAQPSPSLRPVQHHAAALAAESPMVMSTTASAEAESPGHLGLAPVPVAAAPEVPALIVGSQASAVGVPGEYQPSIPTLGGTRGPMILIRGGRGGVEDKCDLHGRHRPGIAINRSAPAFGGYSRGGIR